MLRKFTFQMVEFLEPNKQTNKHHLSNCDLTSAAVDLPLKNHAVTAAYCLDANHGDPTKINKTYTRLDCTTCNKKNSLVI